MSAWNKFGWHGGEAPAIRSASTGWMRHVAGIPWCASGCHSTQNTSGTGAQAPLHSDVDVNLAHEYALKAALRASVGSDDCR